MQRRRCSGSQKRPLLGRDVSGLRAGLLQVAVQRRLGQQTKLAYPTGLEANRAQRTAGYPRLAGIIGPKQHAGKPRQSSRGWQREIARTEVGTQYWMRVLYVPQGATLSGRLLDSGRRWGPQFSRGLVGEGGWQWCEGVQFGAGGGCGEQWWISEAADVVDISSSCLVALSGCCRESGRLRRKRREWETTV